jgi:hypothetical protein
MSRARRMAITVNHSDAAAPPLGRVFIARSSRGRPRTAPVARVGHVVRPGGQVRVCPPLYDRPGHSHHGHTTGDQLDRTLSSRTRGHFPSGPTLIVVIDHRGPRPRFRAGGSARCGGTGGTPRR